MVVKKCEKEEFLRSLCFFVVDILDLVFSSLYLSVDGQISLIYWENSRLYYSYDVFSSYQLFFCCMVYHDFVHVVVSTCCVIFYLVVFLELSWTSSSISRWKVIPTSAHCPPVATGLPWLLEEEGTYFDANLNSVWYVWWRIPRKVHVYMFNACFIVFQSVSILIFQGYDRGWVNREYCTYSRHLWYSTSSSIIA